MTGADGRYAFAFDLPDYFAGSGLVHMTGGFAALAGAIGTVEVRPLDRTEFEEAKQAKEAEAGGIERRIIPPAAVLGFPVLRLTSEEERRVLHGGEIPARGIPLVPGRRVSALEAGGELIAVLEVCPGRRLRPVRVLRSLATPG